MTRRFALCVAALSLAATAHAQDLTKRPAPQATPIAIVHASVHPVSAPLIEDGYVLFDKGVIVDVGAMKGGHAFANGVRQIDATGQHVYPGLIGAWTRLGLTEIDAIRATHDMNEAGDVSPEVYASVAVNPDSTLLPVTRVNGILAAGVFPSGGTLPGRGSVIRLEGWTSEDMTVRKDIGLVVAWPYMRTITAWWMDKSEEDQRKETQKAIDRIRDSFRLARAYLAEKDGPGGEKLPLDMRWEAMRGALGKAKGSAQLPTFIEASDYDQITAAVAFALEEKLKPVIVGGRDAALCAALLKKHDVPVLITGTLTFPKRDDSPYNDVYSLPLRLQEAGVRWCVSSGDETPHERNLPYSAAMAVAHGLSNDAGLRSVTLSAAEILGVADVLGSLDKNKEATLIVTDGDPLEVATAVKMAFIQGKQIDLSTKQSVLAEKYREKYVKPAQPK